MNILITGSSGQIGTNLALALLDRGHRVMGIDKRPNTWTPRIETLLLDLTADVEGLWPEGPFDAVVHLAANAKVFELVEHPRRALDNVLMLFNVLDYCRRERCPIIFGSSREVYGDIHQHVTDEDSADFVVAESPYSASKISGEAFIYSYAQCYELPYLVFRFSNVYGRYDNDLARMERVTPLFLKRIAAGEPIVVFGREKVFDFTYVDDCVEGILAGIEALCGRRVSMQTINLACGQGSTLVDLVNILALALGKPASVTYEPARVGEVTRYVADISKARELLGYAPKFPLTAGLPRYVEWSRQTGAI
ncbi:MAG: NAD-dependent epimerase/dehydratase family protein [Phycisphaerales bacterium]|nr:NAD-dependent epimerase/dehydratase family protein [Phycisphaerales bacterium]